ncbi:MAG: hypothetical protein AM326_04200 [Candidatus Thorarchaeota archaeon SMTZ-45]|nr:MAG: hypothetical protein AM326_04200 [Candidatus Thorarchaeota archaeon SMTZ-45]KXH72580.1 MAG: hypothetical protein AM325_00690 [Candidatus Thorarchaeota archaeon SMTZ1-45]
MKKDTDYADEEKDSQIKQHRRERAREYLIEVADLNSLIVKELRANPNGLSIDEIVKRIPNYSSEHYKDAINSAIEDEYIELVTRDDGLEWYRAILLEYKEN